jgi:hypothetical protein
MESEEHGRAVQNAGLARSFALARSAAVTHADATKGGLLVRYVTHQFAHTETLDKARRWLVQAGFEPSRIQVQMHGMPRLAVAVGPGEFAEVEMLIDAAEVSDPDGFPSLMELARREHVYPEPDEPAEILAHPARAASFVIGWRPIDNDREISQNDTETHLREAYVERGD